MNITREVKITAPEGYEIDKENSTFECIKFKLKSLTYNDIARRLFDSKKRYFFGSTGRIHEVDYGNNYYDANNATSTKQIEKLLAINKLMNVAKYLNGDWKPNWNDFFEHKHFISIEENKIKTAETIDINRNFVYFKTRELTKQAIDILREDTIRLALSTDW